ncbi:hypothetical protein V865_004104 [Kwoniella europaea PYCC6329]|uniref:Ricin B lectin domain-containing protein n=1 Tax=Kwoniella europaea PYCC6329 TaxID=1423913 RepID=A0AAX4KIQ3_9TREE
MLNLAALLPFLALSAPVLAKPLPSGEESAASSTESTLSSMAVSGYPSSIAAETLTESASSSEPSSSSPSSVVAVDTSTGSENGTTATSTAADSAQSTIDIYSHETVHNVQIQAYRDTKCLSPDPREELKAGAPVDLYPCVNSEDPSKNARAWDVVPGEGALVLSGTNFALDAGGVNASANSSLVLKESQNCEPLQAWYVTNDSRIAIAGQGLCLTEDKDTDGSGPDEDKGIILFDCSDENTDQNLVPIAPPDANYTAVGGSSSAQASASGTGLAAVQTDLTTSAGSESTSTSESAVFSTSESAVSASEATSTSGSATSVEVTSVSASSSEAVSTSESVSESASTSLPTASVESTEVASSTAA